MKTKLIIILSIIHFIAFGQTSFDDIDTSLIKNWTPKFEIEYQAAYHFGDSEWETKLILIASLDNGMLRLKVEAGLVMAII